MSTPHGDEIHFSLRSTDVNTAPIEVPLFDAGTTNVRTLESNEFLEIDSISLVVLATGDYEVYIGDSAAPAAGETVVRGDFDNTGGIAQPFIMTSRVGAVGKAMFVTGTIVTSVNVNGTGRIRR